MTDLGTISYGVPLSSLANLENVSELSNKQSAKPNSFAQYRTKEHDKLLGQYGAEYNRGCERRENGAHGTVCTQGLTDWHQADR